MIEIRWVKIKHGNIKQETEQISKSTNVAGYPCILQYREVVERYEDGSAKITTEWQDVEVASE